MSEAVGTHIMMGLPAAMAAPFDLRQIDGSGDEPRVRDLDVAERLGMADPHSIRVMIRQNWTELAAYGEVSERQSETSLRGGRPGREFWLNEGQALTICALSRTPTAARVRKALIDVFMQWRRRPAVDPMAVLNDPAAMRGLLLTYAEKVIALQAENAAMRPDVQALERIAKSDGSLCITDAAKTLQVRPQDLFRHLRAQQWIYRRAGSAEDIAYQNKLITGYLEHKTRTVERADGTEKTVTQVRVTPKGLARLARDLGVTLSAAA